MPTVPRLPREPTARWKAYVRSSSSASPTVRALIRSLDAFITTTQHNPSAPTSTSVAVVRRDQSSHETGNSSRTGILVAVLVSVFGIFLIIALPLWFCRQPRHPPSQGSESKSPSPSLPPPLGSIPPPYPPPTYDPGAAARPSGGPVSPIGPGQGSNQHAGSQPTQGTHLPLPSTRPVMNPTGLSQIVEIPTDQSFRAPVAPAPVQNPPNVTQEPISAQGHQADGATFDGQGRGPVASKRKFRRIKPDKNPHGRREIEDKINPGYFLRHAQPERRAKRRREPKGDRGEDILGDDKQNVILPEVTAFVDKVWQRAGKGNVKIGQGEFRRSKRRHTATM
ncbi:uncharacterized protein BKA78DRAFT_70622 [Phyllosticta capitalensis]|uniref:uncharacterized protein n=1 Tax=Phyllosticta capitalensis TaxID=121624 RepID=UPI00312E22AC